MFKILLITALRQIRRFRTMSAITIFGLSTGFTCIFLLSIWIWNEIQFDRFYDKSDRIYKVYVEEHENGKISKHPWVPFPIAEALRTDIPGIENSTIVTNGSIKVKYNNQIYYENRTCFTDAEIFDVFDLEFIQGNADLALGQRESIVISEKTAKKYFGDKNPIGKELQVNDDYLFRVSAVIKDVPKNSSFNFDFFVLAKFYSEAFIYNGINWEALNFNSYVCLKENVTTENVLLKTKHILNEYMPDQKKYVGMQPIKKSHFYNVSGSPTNIKSIKILLILGIVICLVALINYLNISLGNYYKRRIEFNTKGILGAAKKQLALQIVTETILTISISTILALLISMLLLPSVGKISEIQFSIVSLFHKNMLLIIGSTFLASILICVIPLKIVFTGTLSRLSAKENKQNKSKYAYNYFFVIFQFAASILLIISVFVVSRQLNYISKKEIGLNPIDVITLPLKGGDIANYPVLKEELLRSSAVENVTAAYNWPTQIGTNCNIIAWPGNPHQEKLALAYTVVDKDYFSTMGMTLVQGVPFSQKMNSDTVAYILNESAIKAMDLENPVGSEIDFGCWTKGKVVGVVKDFHYKSMRSSIKPLIIVNHLWGAQHLLVKLSGETNQTNLAEIENIWKTINPNSPFNYLPLENTTSRMYKKEIRFNKLLMTCCAIAIILSAIGLFGIILQNTQRRTKEIGIRKVNGAKVNELLSMLNTEFIKWIIIAFLIASPIAYYTMNKWLENFAYKTTLSWWIFALAGVLASGIALITVSYQSWKAATKNPIESLKYE